MDFPEQLSFTAAAIYPGNVDAAINWIESEKEQKEEEKQNKDNNSPNKPSIMFTSKKQSNYNNSYDNVFNKHFIPYCLSVHYNLASKQIKKSGYDKIKKEVINCCLLSKWIYNPVAYEPLLNETNIIIKKHVESKDCQTMNWSFMLNELNKTAYIVFRGTSDKALGIDVLTDISFIPQPIWYGNDDIHDNDEKKMDDDVCDWINTSKYHKNRFHFAVHGGMYAAVSRNIGTILESLRKHHKDINKLYITGHSLGGGLAILFGLELLLKNIIKMNKMDCNIIVFGAPNVISLEKPIKDILSEKAKQLLTTLHSMTHCFVNRFDVVPRIPSAWILEVLLPSMPDIAQEQIGFLPGFAVKHFTPSYFEAAKESFKQHKKILNTFKSFGTFYILLHDKDRNAFIIDDCADIAVIRQILSFIPPISTKIHGKDCILAHYFYQFIEGVDFNNEDQSETLIKQRKLEFGDEVWWPIPYDSVREYSQMKRYLFQPSDWTKLIRDHYLDSYLEGIIDQELQNKLQLKSKMEYIMAFDCGNECGTGSTWWIDDETHYVESVCGTLKLQTHSQSKQSSWLGTVIQTARKYGAWSTHDDPYRIIMKSKILTNDKWKELYHSNDLKELRQKFTKTKEIMHFYQNKNKVI